MRMRIPTLTLIVLAASCVRSPFPSSVPVEDDQSVVFPSFLAQPSTAVGEPGKHYAWDGELLRAVLIATNDFLPYRTRNVPCHRQLEAQRYHVIREGDVIFVYIYEDENYCGGGYVALDSGVKYAISSDGRILRRVFDGQPEQHLDESNPDGGVPAKPGVVPGYEPVESNPPEDVSPAPVSGQDGGIPVDGGVSSSPWTSGLDGGG
ncbi:hypothetical protein MEBOL_003478 [Melittangium boletus DSM 14713]|uniref:Lipoprotein n=1 Tax=Melittangium boletus DSM 14713 TaxID=1294270 RepID=A0A250IFL3_9BACT|nr:hypothetical protein MEBOL_003478 [Melittangium boletus DSM 14713]